MAQWYLNLSRLSTAFFFSTHYIRFTLNIKSLALSALVALSTVGVAAEAAPTKCALRDSSEVIEFTCDHSLRTNANGHRVNDITFFDGGKRYDWSVIFWTNDAGTPTYAEAWHNGQRIVTDAYIAQNGAWCLSNNGNQLCVH